MKASFSGVSSTKSGASGAYRVSDMSRASIDQTLPRMLPLIKRSDLRYWSPADVLATECSCGANK